MASHIKSSLNKTIDTKKEETYFDALGNQFLTADDSATKDFENRQKDPPCPMDFCAKDAPN